MFLQQYLFSLELTWSTHDVVLRCTATVAAVYWVSSEKNVEGRLPQTGPALESKAVYSGERCVQIVCNDLVNY